MKLQFYKVTWFNQTCPLSFYARLIHSYLTFKAKFKKPVAQSDIARALRLNATNNVRPAIEELSERGLLEQTKSGYLAKPFPSDWVCCNPKKAERAEDWWQRRNDFFYAIPSKVCKLTTIQAVVYFVCLHYQKKTQKRTSYGAIARVTGLSERQVGAAVRKLIGLKLLVKSNWCGALFRPIMKSPPADWFAKKKNKAVALPELQTGIKYVDAVLAELHRQNEKPDLLVKLATVAKVLDGTQLNPALVFDAEEYFLSAVKVAKKNYTRGRTYAALLVDTLTGQANKLGLRVG